MDNRNLVKTFRWRKYPDELPDEDESDLLVILEDGTIQNSVFYRKEDSQHDDSIWREIKYWVRFSDLTIKKNELI